MGQSNGYLSISDLAKELDVKKSHIRFCEQNGLIPPKASKFKRRVYNRYDRERLKFIFHFVLLGYPKEQIIDLIGMADANLDEKDQMTQGVEYGLKALEKLEKRKEELSFTKQTRIINEIEMLHEYINKLKAITSGVFEEISAGFDIKPDRETRVSPKPVREITGRAEKKTTQHPVKAFFLFAVGLTLVILMGSYFYYQTGQKDVKTIKHVQEKAIHSEKIRAAQSTVPMDQIDKIPSEVRETQKLAPSSSDIPPNDLKTTPDKSIADSTLTKEIAPIMGDSPLSHEKEKPGSLQVEEMSSDAVQEEAAGKGLSEKVPSAAEDEDSLAVSAPEPVKDQVSDVEVKEAPQFKFAETASPVRKDLPLSHEKEKSGSLQVEEMSRETVREEVAGERLSEKSPFAAEGEDSLKNVAEPEAKKAAETEVRSALTDAKVEKEQITSETNVNQQKNELIRIKSFLDEYCQAYTNKNLDKFITFFTPDAVENSTPFRELLPEYREKMKRMKSLTYRIELLSFSKQADSKNLMVRGKFFARYQSENGEWEEKSGSIFMELLENKYSFLVKQLNY